MRAAAPDPLDGLSPDEAEDLAGEDNSLNSFISYSRQYPDPPTKAAYYGLPGLIARTIEPESESDPVAILAQTLCAFGNAIGHGPYYRAEADRHTCNLFLLLVGATSKGRKGSSWGQVRRIFEQVDEEWVGNRIRGGLQSGEAVINEVRDKIEVQEPVREKGIVTGYQMVVKDPGISDKRLLVFAPEFSQILKVAGREGNITSDILRQAWETGNLRNMTKNSPLQATDAHVSLVGHITIPELRRELSTTDMASGLANRFIFLTVRRSKCLPEGGSLPSDQIAGLAEQLRGAIEFSRTVQQMYRDDAARRLWREVYPELSEGQTGMIGAILGRAEAQVLRLSIIYALMDCSAIIRQEHLEAALALWEYSEAAAKFIFGDSLGDPTADEILRNLRLIRPAGLNRTDISSLFGRNKNALEINRALLVLIEGGLARCKRSKSENGGRPEETWYAV
jgi:hypothetical protein